MANLTLDLLNPQEVEFGHALLTHVLAEQRQRTPQAGETAPVGPEEEGQEEAADMLRHEVRGLLQTKTGRVLIEPFARQFPNGASIEEIGAIIPCDEGVDRVRKAHSLIAGLGRWETPRQIRVFDPIGGRPQKYRMNPDVLAIVSEELAQANQAE